MPVLSASLGISTVADMAGRKAATTPKTVTRIEDDTDRKLFHNRQGNLDISRLVEQLIPLAIVGGVVVYANSLVTQSQVGESKTRIEALERELREVRSEQRTTNATVVGLLAKIDAYLGQQTTLNQAMDQRILFLERSGNPRR